MMSCCLGTVVLDFDLTLAQRKKLTGKGDFQECQRQGWRITEWGSDSYGFKFRPSARPFIEQLYQEGLDVWILTYSDKPSRTAHFIEMGGMSDLIPASSIWGRNCVLPEFWNPWVLVDDQPAHTGKTLHKLRQLGLRQDLVRRRQHHIVTCQAFDDEGDACPLTEHLCQVTDRIYTQIGWSFGAEIETHEHEGALL